MPGNSGIGLSTLADLWASRPPRSLPGALWRLYFIREWMRTDAAGVGRVYAAGVRFTEPNHVVAGIDPPRPEDVRRIADDILRGAFTGDFAIALERASAFCHVVASGRAEVALAAAAEARGLTDRYTSLPLGPELFAGATTVLVTFASPLGRLGIELRFLLSATSP